MTEDEIIVLTYGKQAVSEARRIARECPVGFVVVHELEDDRVYYRHVHSDEEIETDFKRQHIHIASHVFPPGDPDFLEWNRGNSETHGTNVNFYKVKGK